MSRTIRRLLLIVVGVFLLTRVVALITTIDDVESEAAPDPPPQAFTDWELHDAVIDGAVPPMALGLLSLDGRVQVDFVAGPRGEHDVVRTRAGGARGPKLAWDLDGDGRVERPERTITERELHDHVRSVVEQRERRR